MLINSQIEVHILDQKGRCPNPRCLAHLAGELTQLLRCPECKGIFCQACEVILMQDSEGSHIQCPRCQATLALSQNSSWPRAGADTTQEKSHEAR